jgi:hypothetical protein
VEVCWYTEGRTWGVIAHRRKEIGKEVRKKISSCGGA